MSTPKLAFHLNWLNENIISLVSMVVTIDNVPIWPVAGDDNSDLEVFADDILAFLAENWHSILLEQAYPIYSPSRPSLLRQTAEVAWDQDENRDAEDEDLKIEEFERTHNLALCFAGMMGIPPLWLVRRDKVIVIDNGDNYWEPSLKQVQQALCELGNDIVKRFVDKKKFSRLLTAWENRSNKDALTLLATSASIPRSYAENLVDTDILRAPSSFEDAANDEDELRIAARVTGALSLEQVRSILSVAKSIPSNPSDELQRIKEAISEELHKLPSSAYWKPYNIGVNAAISARKLLNYSSAQRIDLEHILGSLRILWKCSDDQAKSFKGLAIWGNRHGPGIVVAASGADELWRSGFCRVTIAHELGHLLMDSNHAIGAVDVLRGRTPPHIEQRAKSFAGEFLLPTKTVADAWQQANHPIDYKNLSELIETLQDKYGVTKAVATWKLEHGLKALGVDDLSDLLYEIAPER